MKCLTGPTTINQLDATDLDDTVPFGHFQPRRFSIQHYLPHWSILSISILSGIIFAALT
jgi:hypothetical protein